MTSKRIGVIGSAGIPANYGGFETLVDNLVRHLNRDFKFIVYCSSPSYPEKRSEYHGARLIYINLNANGRSSILYDAVSILNAMHKVDVLLVLGVGGAFLFPLIRLFSRKKVVINIDGLEWKRQKWGRFAKWYLKVQEWIAVKFAHTVVADNEAIQQYIQSCYQKESFYAAYGGDHAREVVLSEATQRQYGIQKGNYCFTVCRIEPENNIHIILDAFSKTPGLKIVFVGNWKASEYGKSLHALYQNKTNIQLLDPIYEQSRLDELRSNCLAYLHGHSAGGTNPSLVEAMYLGLAVVAWDVDYNRFTTENNALYFTDSVTLQEVLLRIQNNKIDLKTISEKAKSVAERKYTWRIVADQYGAMLNG